MLLPSCPRDGTWAGQLPGGTSRTMLPGPRGPFNLEDRPGQPLVSLQHWGVRPT